jgi:hypothetical protein
LAHCYAQGGHESSTPAAARHPAQAFVLLDIYSKKKQARDSVAAAVADAGAGSAYSTIRLTIRRARA